MTDTASIPLGVCRIYQLTGIRCRDCPKRRPAAVDPATQPLRLGAVCDYRIIVRREKDNTGAPDSERFIPLGRSVTGMRPLPPYSPKRCCED